MIPGAEERDELATSALLGERRNRPVYLVVLAGVLAAGALIALISSAIVSGRALKERSRQLDMLGRTQQLAAELDAMRARESTDGADDPYERNPDLLTRIEALAKQAGMAKPALPVEGSNGRGALHQVLLQYKQLRDDDVGRVISWITSVVREIPGVEVYKISIRPLPTQWQIDVTFSRWERQ